MSGFSEAQEEIQKQGGYNPHGFRQGRQEAGFKTEIAAPKIQDTPKFEVKEGDHGTRKK